MDISNTTEPKSDQQNYDDYIAGPKTVTVADVKVVGGEQPVELHLTEFPGRPYKPGKSMRRVLIAAWGADASAYIGRQMRLYGDPSVRWAGAEVGGIRIEALSHIDKPLVVSLTVTRSKRAPFTVAPLVIETTRDTSGRDWLKELADTNGDTDLIGALGKAARDSGANPATVAVIRKAYQDANNGREDKR